MAKKRFVCFVAVTIERKMVVYAKNEREAIKIVKDKITGKPQSVKRKDFDYDSVHPIETTC